MAVTLYRCSKCRGLFNSVFGTGENQVCRDCKFGGGVGGSPDKTVVTKQDVKIVEAGEKESKLDELNRLTQAVFERSPSLGQFDGGKQISQPFIYQLPVDPDQKYKFTFSGFEEAGAQGYRSTGEITGRMLENGRIALDNPIFRINKDGSMDVLDLIDSDILLPQQAVSESLPAPVPEPTADPHSALLNPKRKLRLGS